MNTSTTRLEESACNNTARIIGAVAMLMYATASATAENAQEAYPSKPIRFIVGFPPGGGNDTLARVIGQKLSEQIGRPVVIDNRPGAGGNLAAQLTAKSPPDGYTLLMISSSHPIQALLKKGLPYDPIADFAGVSQLVVYRSVLVTHPNLQANSVRDLIALMKSRPGQINFVSSGNGSGSHLAGELFKNAARVDMTHVPYKGTAQAITDLIGGRVQLMFAPVQPVMPQVQAGKLRALGVTSRNRSRVMPDVPPISEAGLPGYEFVGWYGILTAAGTPKSRLEKLNSEIIRILSAPDVVEKLHAEDMDIIKATPEHLDAVRKADLAKWTRIVRATGIQAD
ncbi:MAG: tripartite tricarboxylate transporter substrate binding protein [Burkholderiales bacterium]